MKRVVVVTALQVGFFACVVMKGTKFLNMSDLHSMQFIFSSEEKIKSNPRCVSIVLDGRELKAFTYGKIFPGNTAALCGKGPIFN